MPFPELFGVNDRQALEFFSLEFFDLLGESVGKNEVLYNASILAHFSSTPCGNCSADGLPTPANLSAVFDHFVSDTTLLRDSMMMEAAGGQCLLLAGFFEDQMRERHNIHWWTELGAGFFSRAANAEQSGPKAQLLWTQAKNFEPWRRRHARLGRELRDRPYLIFKPS